MADDEDQSSSGIPAWQRGSDDSNTAAGKADEDQLAVARRFLEDEEVKTASRDKKVAFLKAKGIEDGDIEKLLGEAEQSQPSSETPEAASSSTTNTTTSVTTSTPPSTPPSSSSASPPSDRAPIVTYPEFLTNQQSNAQPPLVTTAGLLTTLQVASVLSTILVGSSKFILSPMLDRLTDSRLDYHAHTATKLDALTSLLENNVSVIPPKSSSGTGHGEGDDSSSEADDPSEMFHRDIGTQTVQPVAVPSTQAVKPAPAEEQAARVEGLTKKLADIKDGLRNQSDDLGDIKTLVDVFRDDLDALTYKSPGDVAGLDMAGVYGSAGTGRRKGETDDEMKKARDNIRRIKGVLLSTRSFPTTTR